MKKAYQWFASLGYTPATFQEEAWQAYASGQSGLVNAPTGSGKTYALLLPILLQKLPPRPGLVAVWITPIRALAKEIHQSTERAIAGMELPHTVGVRTGDTKTAERNRQKNKMPNILITTPESLHLLLATKGYPQIFKHLHTVVADEWHELMGSKRAVQMELALSRLRTLNHQLQTWGISATMGNMQQSMDVLLGVSQKGVMVKARLHKEIKVQSILPDTIETLPWAGHLGIKMLEKVLPIIEKSESTLIFTNTRSQAEIWYQRLLEVAPHLAGQIAMHHGSISRELRFWVEDALYNGQLKAVVCTSSLDLGVDFRPVESIVQIGSPKGVGRFMQRAGRSGHQPGAVSTIYFVPTHTLELVEAAALREAMGQNLMEERVPYLRSFDVLVQYLVTLAVSEGFFPDEIRAEIERTFSFSTIRDEEWQWCLQFIVSGGASLQGYDEYHKVQVNDEGLYQVKQRRTAMRHRMSMGTIVSDTAIRIKFQKGGFLGTIEEYFISRLKIGDAFWFAGRHLELVRFRGTDATVRLARQKKGVVPSWQGGRMPLSAQMGAMLRQKLEVAFAAKAKNRDMELQFIEPLWEVQRERSAIPRQGELLVESMESREGYHVFMYPFEGRFVHEGMAALLAYRLAQLQPVSLSLAMNDYGFELLANAPIPIEEALQSDILNTDNLREDIFKSVNAVELARRRFRDIASISGLVFRGYPGKPVKDKHLQSSAQLLFKVFEDYDPHNLLLRQAYDEALEFQLEEGRLRLALERIEKQDFVFQNLEKPSPFCFPIMVDRLRERLTSESLEDRVKKMQVSFR